MNSGPEPRACHEILQAVTIKVTDAWRGAPDRIQYLSVRFQRSGILERGSTIIVATGAAVEVNTARGVASRQNIRNAVTIPISNPRLFVVISLETSSR